jgi:hypothetical protein
VKKWIHKPENKGTSEKRIHKKIEPLLRATNEDAFQYTKE